ncbi:AP-4 complex accessory subunit tepsin, partial [Hyalella azteca]|uniref:AP-4 complex accessory subunit tepsin n=1 Tax=Hyalella azteca TaxID=294128 RepID=A0A8B7NT95_HYAAZ
MEILKGAQTAVNFASYFPLLHKATADNDTPCPGYVYDEIIKLSYASAGHRCHLVDFLLSRLQASGCCGKQKVVSVMKHLTDKGHAGVRQLLRIKDTAIRAIAGGGAA